MFLKDILVFGRPLFFLSRSCAEIPATKQTNAVILSNAKNLAFLCCYEILHGACPELNYETLRFTQGDKRRVQDDNYNCRVNKWTKEPFNGIYCLQIIHKTGNLLT